MKINRRNISPKQRSILPFAFKLNMVMTLITAVITMSVVVVGYTLPDTGAVAFIANQHEKGVVYAYDLARGTLAHLTDIHASVGGFVFSPNGRQMLFTAIINNDYFYQLYLKTVKCNSLFASCNSNLQKLTDGERGVGWPSWSPNGNQMAYMSDIEIYVRNTNGGTAHNITRNPAADFGPVWSPDGRQIAFSSQRDSDDAELYLMNSDGSHVQRLTHNNTTDYFPMWSPDGTRIAYISYDLNPSVLMVMDLRDSSTRQITTISETIDSFRWSADSSQIEFWISQPQSSLFAVDVLHNGARKLVTSLTGPNQNFTWLPDGRFTFLRGISWYVVKNLYLLDGDQMRFIAHNTNPSVWWP